MVSHGGFVAYYRVSTSKQGKSGLGIEAQRAAVTNYLNGGNWRIIGEFTEIESGRLSARLVGEYRDVVALPVGGPESHHGARAEQEFADPSAERTGHRRQIARPSGSRKDTE